MAARVLGIDPGANGAVVLIDQDKNILSKYIFERCDDGAVDIDSYLRHLTTLEVDYACLERVQGIQGANRASTFKLARNYQVALDGLKISGIPYGLVVPRVWQKAVYGGSRRSGEKPKAVSKRIALKEFSGEHFLKSDRCRTPHDGLMDAALIALYGLKTNDKEIK